jgi:multiple sugar transport system permease protein
LIGLPKDMEEAAFVDGASLFGIYWRIIVPLSRPVFATVAILKFLTHWNDFLWPLMVTRGETYRPLMVAIQQFFSQDPKVWGDIMAFASMITIPVLIVFLLFQKWFVQSVATTGVKG